jgi:diadenosine tetraphosphatase ApaH/serine/threonine PP2A family protein phosphatase
MGNGTPDRVFLFGSDSLISIKLNDADAVLRSHHASLPMKAIISDIHANLEALRAVLDDIAAQGVREIYCLGDLVGYGPNPRECIDLLMNCSVVLLGNHDRDALNFEGESTLPPHPSSFWTRRQLAIPDPDHDRWHRRREFLDGLPRTHHEGDFLFVHGSPRNPVEEYIFPEDIYHQRKMEKIFALVGRYCFLGHTHLPGIFTEDLRFLKPEEFDSVWQLDGRKTLCNVGSVGQPRDGDPRACYVLLDNSTIRFRRVNFDIDTLRGKIDDMNDF